MDVSNDVVPFERPKKPDPKPPVKVRDVEQIGFLTVDGRDLWIEDMNDITKIIAFIVREKIKIVEG